MDDAEPIAGYDALGAREVMRILAQLPSTLLTRLHVYEQRHRRRTQVLGAIRRALQRCGTAGPDRQSS